MVDVENLNRDDSRLGLANERGLLPEEVAVPVLSPGLKSG
jgi:hypothetical protein